MQYALLIYNTPGALEAASLDEATAMAARLPVARLGGSVEVQPVIPARGQP